MNRVLATLVLTFAACGGSGFNTGEATVTGVTPAVHSASISAFLTTTTPPTMGWTIDFIEPGAGTDCMDTQNNIVASIGIYTNQADDGKHVGATLTTGDITIVTMAPPTVNGTAAANMAVTGLHGVVGTVTVTDFYKDHIYGTINAAGTDSGGTGVAITGTFKAPICVKP
jgi:hypothetical protein